MNQVQQAIARVVGLEDVLEQQQSQLGELNDAFEHIYSDNQMLQRTLEDIDYLNLYDLGGIKEVLPGLNREETLTRLRRLRHDNPLAKQAVKLIVRFTLGKGIQWVLAAETPVDMNAAIDQGASPGGPGENPDPNQAPPTSRPAPPPTRFVQLPRRARAPEAFAPVEVGPPASNGNGKVKDTGDEYGPGEKTSAEPSEDSDPIRIIVEAFWNDPDNKLILTSHRAMQEMLDDVVTDGEKFYACFVDKAEPYLKVTEIPINEIDGIIYNPDNRVEPVLYRRKFHKLVYDGENDMYKPDGQPQVKYYMDYRITDEKWAELKKTIQIPASKLETEKKIRHVYINPIWTKNGKRGVSELYASREWFRVFREFMEGRAAINQAAQAISYKRKIKGGPTAVAQFQGKFGGLPVGNSYGTETQKLTRPLPGATYDSNEAVDLEWMKTDTGAAGAAQDAKMLLTTGGAGVGVMAHYFGEGGDANLATAQSMELPMVKTYEDWQQWVEEEYEEWIHYVLVTAIEDKKVVDEALTRLGFTFPPIISQDVVKYTTSWSQIVRDIAPNNMIVKREAIRGALAIMNVPNLDGIMPEIEAQMVHAEQLRIQQQQMLAQSLAASGDRPGAAPTTPNEAVPPNMKHLVAGKGEKASNGPKPA